MNQLVIILLLPFLGAILAYIFKPKAVYMALGAMAISAALALIFFNKINQINTSYHWISIANTSINLQIFTDQISTIFLAIVAIIGTLVLCYSQWYMQLYSSKPRYYATLCFFCGSMMALIVSGNLLQLFFFWEWIGLASYLLIGFWRTKPEAGMAAFKAFIFNRIGDSFLLLGIFLIYLQYHTLDIQKLSSAAPISAQTPYGIWISLSLLLGVSAKSAQWPLNNWLPDAMQGPTPVSSLIHAATLVASGVYLIFRLLPMVALPNSSIMLWVGLATALSGALAAMAQKDLKRLLAYSTISQLGYMFVALGISAGTAAMTHLFTHAFFKCLLFLCAGVLIHYFPEKIYPKHFFKTNKTLFVIHLLAACALAGVPFTSGFLSKELIYSALISKELMAVFLLLLCTSFITSFYIFRSFFSIYIFGENENKAEPIFLSPWVKSPLILLAIACVAWPAYNISAHNNIITWLPWLSAAVSVVGIGVAYFASQKAWQPTFVVLEHYFYIDTVNKTLIIKPTLMLSKVVFWIEKNILDGIITNLKNITLSLSRLAEAIDTNIIDGAVHSVAAIFGSLSAGLGRVQGSGLQARYRWALAILLIGVLVAFYYY